MRKTGSVVAWCVCAGVTAMAYQGGQGAPGGQAAAQPPPTLVVEVQRIFTGIKTNITGAAEQFPEDKYTWQPTPAVRTWARLMGHIADDNNGACAALAGVTPAPARLETLDTNDSAANKMSKADLVKALNDSFALCDKAFTVVTPENMMERQGNRSKIGALMYNTSHINEHYGNIVTYMRLQNLVPPSTANRGRGRGN